MQQTHKSGLLVMLLECRKTGIQRKVCYTLIHTHTHTRYPHTCTYIHSFRGKWEKSNSLINFDSDHHWKSLKSHKTSIETSNWLLFPLLCLFVCLCSTQTTCHHTRLSAERASARHLPWQFARQPADTDGPTLSGWQRQHVGLEHLCAQYEQLQPECHQQFGTHQFYQQTADRIGEGVPLQSLFDACATHRNRQHATTQRDAGES